MSKKFQPIEKNQSEQFKQLETFFEPVANLFSQYITIDNIYLIYEILPILLEIKYFCNACPQGTDLQEFFVNLITKFQYEFYEKGTIIFHMGNEQFNLKITLGEQGNKFYFILKGEVSVFIPREESKIKEEDQQNESRFRSAFTSVRNLDCEQDENKIKQRMLRKQNLKNQSQIDSELLLFRVATRINRLDQYFTEMGICKVQQVDLRKKKQLNFKIVQLHAGQIFGEQALTTDKPRGATILTKTDVKLLSLQKQDYKVIFLTNKYPKKVFERQIRLMNQKIEFFMKLFPNVTKYNISKFVLTFEEKIYPPNTIIWKEGDSADFFLILYELFQGTLQIEKRHIEQQQQSDSNLLKKTKVNRIIVLNQENIYQVSTITAGNFAGDQEVLLKQSRSYTCKTIEQVRAFYIASDVTNNSIYDQEFNIVKKIYPEAYSTLNERLENLNWIEDRVQKIIAMKSNGGNLNFGNRKNEYIERIRVAEIDKQFISSKSQPEITPETNSIATTNNNSPQIKMSKRIIPQSQVKQPIRSDIKQNPNKKEIIDYNANVFQTLLGIQQSKGIEKDFNLLKMANPNILKSLKIRVEKQYESYQPAKPKGETPHFIQSRDRESLISQLKTSRACHSRQEDEFQNNMKELFININGYGVDDKSQIISDRRLILSSYSNNRIINPSLRTKTREFQNSRRHLKNSTSQGQNFFASEKMNDQMSPPLNNLLLFSRPIHSNQSLGQGKLVNLHRSLRSSLLQENTDNKKINFLIFNNQLES